MAQDNDDVTEEIVDENLDTETVSEMAELKAQMDELRQTNQAMLQMLQPKKPTVEDISDDEVERLAKDPRKMAEFIKAKVSDGQRAVNVELAKNRFDSQAYEDFPALKTNKQFQQSVVAQMKELTSGGEYQSESPKLLLRAAQLAAAKLKPGRNGDQADERPTSGAPSQRTSNVASRSTSHIKDNDPRVQFLKLYGIKDPAKIEKFKKTLGPYQPPKQSKARSLDRGDD